METYGGYMEITYIVCDGDLLKMDSVFNMMAHQVLFIGEYLIKKRQIENKELKQKVQY